MSKPDPTQNWKTSMALTRPDPKFERSSRPWPKMTRNDPRNTELTRFLVQKSPAYWSCLDFESSLMTIRMRSFVDPRYRNLNLIISWEKSKILGILSILGSFLAFWGAISTPFGVRFWQGSKKEWFFLEQKMFVFCTFY